MRICVVGGIFEKPPSYQEEFSQTPEATLVRGLKARGHEVVPCSHLAHPFYDQFEIVHVHHLTVGALRAAAAARPTRLVYTAHGMRVDSAGHWLAAQCVMRQADAIVGLSDIEVAWQRRCFGPTGTPSSVIPNGVDYRLFPFSPPPSVSGRWRLLYVGQLTHLKRVHVLVEAVSRLARVHAVELQLVYHVAELEAALRAHVATLSLEQAVRFVGPLPPDQLVDYYRNAHIVVLPSASEALPTVVTEALFTGRPVVASNVGAIKWQLNGFGALVPPDDPEALHRGLARTIERYDYYRELAANASLSARRRFAVDTMVDAHEELYARLLKQPPRRRSPTAMLLRRVATLVVAAKSARTKYLTRNAAKSRRTRGGSTVI